MCVCVCLGTNWASGEDDHVVARAEYDFTAASEEEISLQAGDMLNLAPKGKEHAFITGSQMLLHLMDQYWVFLLHLNLK